MIFLQVREKSGSDRRNKMVVMLLTERNELCALRQLHDEVKSRAGKLTILKCDCMRVVV